MKSALALVALLGWAEAPAPTEPPAPAATAAPEKLRQAGVDVPKPERTKLVKPTYPAEAMSRGEQALVVVELILDEKGKVADARVLHGPEPFAAAALKAAREWEFQPSVVDGKPIRIRYTLPITFALPLPPMKRDLGVPELRQGVAPKVPQAARGQAASAVAHVQVDAEGRIAETTVKTGESPFREALLEALRTWRFASPEDRAPVTFDVRVDFAADGKVSLDLTGPRRADGTAAADTANTAATATPAAAPTVAANTSDAVEAAPPSVMPSEPPVEVISGGSVAPPVAAADPFAASTPSPVENGLSSVRDVELSPGIPDLIRGRRPVAPPLARMGEIEGEVEVRFSIDSGGVPTVNNVGGRDELKDAAAALVKSWMFRRTAAHRVFALALVEYRMSGSKARIRPVP